MYFMYFFNFPILVFNCQYLFLFIPSSDDNLHIIIQLKLNNIFSFYIFFSKNNKNNNTFDLFYFTIYRYVYFIFIIFLKCKYKNINFRLKYIVRILNRYIYYIYDIFTWIFFFFYWYTSYHIEIDTNGIAVKYLLPMWFSTKISICNQIRYNLR